MNYIKSTCVKSFFIKPIFIKSIYANRYLSINNIYKVIYLYDDFRGHFCYFRRIPQLLLSCVEGGSGGGGLRNCKTRSQIESLFICPRTCLRCTLNILDLWVRIMARCIRISFFDFRNICYLKKYTSKLIIIK